VLSTKTQQSDAPKAARPRQFLGRRFLIGTGIVALAAAALNSWVGHDDFYSPADFKSLSANELQIADLKLQLRLAKEQLLRPNESGVEQIYASLGYLRLHQNKKSEAAYFLEKSVRPSLQYLGVDSAPPYYLARIYLDQARVEDALQLIDKWASDSHSTAKTTLFASAVPYHLLHAQIYHAAGRSADEAAANKIAETSAYLPRYIYVHPDPMQRNGERPFAQIYEMAIAAMALEQYPRAKRLMKIAIEGLPDIPSDQQTRTSALLGMAVLNYLSKDPEMQKTFAVAAAIPKTEYGDMRGTFCRAYGKFLRSRGQLDKAAIYEQEERKLLRDDPGAYYPK
jgi:tetratricopeptide (TPR) repeat protein